MSQGNLNASFSVQTLIGPLANIVGLTLSQAFVQTGYASMFNEVFNVNPSVTDQEFDLLPMNNQVLVLMNVGQQDLLYRINTNTGTQLTLPNTTGFAVITTPTAITKLFLTNQSVNQLGSVEVLLIG